MFRLCTRVVFLRTGRLVNRVLVIREVVGGRRKGKDLKILRRVADARVSGEHARAYRKTTGRSRLGRELPTTLGVC